MCTSNTVILVSELYGLRIEICLHSISVYLYMYIQVLPLECALRDRRHHIRRQINTYIPVYNIFNYIVSVHCIHLYVHKSCNLSIQNWALSHHLHNKVFPILTLRCIDNIKYNVVITFIHRLTAHDYKSQSYIINVIHIQIIILHA